MKLRHSQRGMTALGWVIIALLAGIIALGAIRLFPVYMESYAVNSMMRNITSDGEMTETAQIRRALSRHMQVNNITGVQMEEFQIQNINGRRHLVVKYEDRVPFMSNIDFVVSFEKQYEFRGE